jgi:hypothetical protein
MEGILKRKISVCLVALVAAITMAAQEKKDGAKKAPAASGILHPEMTVENGTWDKPMATIGTKPEAGSPWTTTSGKPISVVGEIVDFSCYIQLGKHGEKHRSCGQKCVQNGQPIGLLTRAGQLYMLMPEEHDPRRDGGVDAKASASDHMGHIVQVNGTEASVGSYRAIYVQGLTK